MAHQAGPLRFKGKLGGLSFYHNKQYGYLVRLKGGPDREEIARSPRFARTRENAAEFALAAVTGKLIRQAVWASTGLKGDSNVTQRLTGLLVRMGKADPMSGRGERSPLVVFDETASRALLQGFTFYSGSPLTTVYSGKINYDTTTDSMVFSGPVLSESFDAPKGATHVQIKAAILILDFDNKSYTVCKAPVYTAKLENPMPQADLICDLQTAGSGSRIGVVAIEFLQEKNGELYVLTEGVSLGVVG
jgi:hypothetical protein